MKSCYILYCIKCRDKTHCFNLYSDICTCPTPLYPLASVSHELYPAHPYSLNLNLQILPYYCFSPVSTHPKSIATSRSFFLQTSSSLDIFYHVINTDENLSFTFTSSASFIQFIYLKPLGPPLKILFSILFPLIFM